MSVDTDFPVWVLKICLASDVLGLWSLKEARGLEVYLPAYAFHWLTSKEAPYPLMLTGREKEKWSFNQPSNTGYYKVTGVPPSAIFSALLNSEWLTWKEPCGIASLWRTYLDPWCSVFLFLMALTRPSQDNRRLGSGLIVWWDSWLRLIH